MTLEGSDMTGPRSASADGFIVFVLPETSIAMHPAITLPAVGRRYDIDDLRNEGVAGATTEKGRAPGVGRLKCVRRGEIGRGGLTGNVGIAVRVQCRSEERR